MFCNNCGNQLQDGQRFCSKCGKEHALAEAITCPACGSTVDAGAKFCNNCGAPVQGAEKKFCPHCGRPMQENTSSGHDQTKITQLLGNKLAPNASPEVRVLAIKHAILAGLFVLILIFTFIPTFQIKLPFHVFLGDKKVTEINICAGNILSDDKKELLEYFMDNDEIDNLAVYYGISTFTYIVAFGLAAFSVLYPLITQSISKRRGLVYPFIASIYTVVFVLGNYLFSKIIIKQDSYNRFTLHFTFGGYSLILLGIAAFVLCIMIVCQNHRLPENTDT